MKVLSGTVCATLVYCSFAITLTSHKKIKNKLLEYTFIQVMYILGRKHKTMDN